MAQTRYRLKLLFFVVLNNAIGLLFSCFASSFSFDGDLCLYGEERHLVAGPYVFRFRLLFPRPGFRIAIPV